jgi:hypothetical protein
MVRSYVFRLQVEKESIRQDSQDSHVFHQRFPEEKEILHNPVNPVG